MCQIAADSVGFSFGPQYACFNAPRRMPESRARRCDLRSPGFDGTLWMPRRDQMRKAIGYLVIRVVPSIVSDLLAGIPIPRVKEAFSAAAA